MSQFYKHTRTGGFYELILIARIEGDPCEEMAVYRNNSTGESWARPVAEFFGEVHNVVLPGMGGAGLAKARRFQPVSAKEISK